MARLDDLLKKVKDLYKEDQADKTEWADWLYPNHVVVVTNNARLLAEREGADVELSQVAAALHDVADYKMERTNPKHEAESLALPARL